MKCKPLMLLDLRMQTDEVAERSRISINCNCLQDILDSHLSVASRGLSRKQRGPRLDSRYLDALWQERFTKLESHSIISIGSRYTREREIHAGRRPQPHVGTACYRGSAPSSYEEAPPLSLYLRREAAQSIALFTNIVFR